MKVLIVDDQPAYREVAREVVQATPGFDVIGEAATGEESLEMSRELSPDLVLMDVNLPGIDGMEATRLITATTKAIVFLISTYGSDEYSERAAACGAAGFIPKSQFEPDLLRQSWDGVRP